MNDPIDPPPVPAETTGPQRTILSLIESYQRAFEGRPSPCRFFPSCSSYAHEAVTVHGTRRGGWLALRRLLRCRPLGPSGFDPVPEPTDVSRDPAMIRSRTAPPPHSPTAPDEDH